MKSKFSFLFISSTKLELPKEKNQLYLLLSLVDMNSWKLSRVDDITLKSLNQEHFCKHILMSHNFNGCFSFAFFILSVVVSRGYVLKKENEVADFYYGIGLCLKFDVLGEYQQLSFFIVVKRYSAH